MHVCYVCLICKVSEGVCVVVVHVKGRWPIQGGNKHSKCGFVVFVPGVGQAGVCEMGVSLGAWHCKVSTLVFRAGTNNMPHLGESLSLTRRYLQQFALNTFTSFCAGALCKRTYVCVYKVLLKDPHQLMPEQFASFPGIHKSGPQSLYKVTLYKVKLTASRT